MYDLLDVKANLVCSASHAVYEFVGVIPLRMFFAAPLRVRVRYPQARFCFLMLSAQLAHVALMSKLFNNAWSKPPCIAPTANIFADYFVKSIPSKLSNFGVHKLFFNNILLDPIVFDWFTLQKAFCVKPWQERVRTSAEEIQEQSNDRQLVSIILTMLTCS